MTASPDRPEPGPEPGPGPEPVPDGPAVRREVEDGVAVLTLDRPGEGNALTPGMLLELNAKLAQLRQDRAVKAVVLTGAGQDFCVGGSTALLAEYARDTAEGPGGEGPGGGLGKSLDLLAEAVRTLRRMDRPVLAAVNGRAAGAGFSLALACDLRIAADHSALHLAYGMLGLSTDGGMSWFLPRVLGPGRALPLLLEQQVLRAPAALRAGLVSATVPAAELLPAALRRARALARCAPHAVGAAKRLADLSLTLSLDEHLALEHQEFARGMATRDVRRGLHAHHTGEWPDFHGD